VRNLCRSFATADLKMSTMSKSVFKCCHFVDRTNLMEMRSQHKDTFMEKHGVKLGFMSGFVKVTAKFFLYIFMVEFHVAHWCCCF
jgi:hypothetical protein